MFMQCVKRYLRKGGLIALYVLSLQSYRGLCAVQDVAESETAIFLARWRMYLQMEYGRSQQQCPDAGFVPLPAGVFKKEYQRSQCEVINGIPCMTLGVPLHIPICLVHTVLNFEHYGLPPLMKSVGESLVFSYQGCKVRNDLNMHIYLMSIEEKDKVAQSAADLRQRAQTSGAVNLADKKKVWQKVAWVQKVRSVVKEEPVLKIGQVGAEQTQGEKMETVDCLTSGVIQFLSVMTPRFFVQWVPHNTDPECVIWTLRYGPNYAFQVSINLLADTQSVLHKSWYDAIKDLPNWKDIMVLYLMQWNILDPSEIRYAPYQVAAQYGLDEKPRHAIENLWKPLSAVQCPDDFKYEDWF